MTILHCMAAQELSLAGILILAIGTKADLAAESSRMQAFMDDYQGVGMIVVLTLPFVFALWHVLQHMYTALAVRHCKCLRTHPLDQVVSSVVFESMANRSGKVTHVARELMLRSIMDANTEMTEEEETEEGAADGSTKRRCRLRKRCTPKLPSVSSTAPCRPRWINQRELLH